MRLIQIPFSHNCIKVRRALELKGLAYETLDIRPQDRRAVVAASGQPMVPVLIDGPRCVTDSTAILQYLEQAYPEPSLLPEDASRHAECWLIEDWADGSFMDLTRRLAYWQRLTAAPEIIAQRFFPEARGLKLRIMMRIARWKLTRRFDLSSRRNERDEAELLRLAPLALERIGDRPRLFGDRTTVADLALAAMLGPAHITAEHVRREPTVHALLSWAATVLGDDVMRRYYPA